MTIRDDLQAAYNDAAALREDSTIQQWKIQERQRFLNHLQSEGAQSLLEVGAGIGVHGRWFADEGLQVVATDLAPVMVAHCRAKGLEAYEMDFLSLNFDQPFDAVFGMNCLLHVPRLELQDSLMSIKACLKPGGLAYLGQYGGVEREGTWENDSYEPKRFFSYSPDDVMQQYIAAVFEIVDFRTVPITSDDPLHFQAFIVRRS